MIAGALLVLAVVLAPVAAGAEIRVPPGFSVEVYVTGRGQGPDGRVAVGIPSATSLGFDATGAIYTTRTGRRYRDGEIEDLWPLLRFPPGGARLGADLSRHMYGPPLLNAQIGPARGDELLVTTFDRDRGLGVLYRLVDGRAELLAGGTPPPGQPPLFKQPEGVAVDAAGHLYVADRQRGAVVKLDAAGRVLDGRWLVVTRPRLIAARDDRIWVAADGDTEAPWLSGHGEVWTIRGDDRRVVLSGLIVAGMDVGAGGRLFLADRHAGRILAVGADGISTDIAGFTDGDTPRALAWSPVTEATRRAGIAGELFVVVTRRGAWSLNEIVRISGPFDDLLRSRPAAR
jgi:NHL repeat